MKKTSLSVFAGFALSLLVSGIPGSVSAQNEERRKFVESLFRSVIEARMRDELEKQTPKPGVVPAKPADGRPIPAARVVTDPGGKQRPNRRRDPQMAAYERKLTNIASLSNRLVINLNRHSTIQGARQYIPAALKLNSGYEVLLANCQRNYNFDGLTGQYRSLDREWRHLSYQLRSLPGFDQETRDGIADLDSLSTNMCQFLQIAPQFDRDTVLRSTYMQAAYLDSLMDAVDFELHHEPDCQDILAQGRRLKDQLLRLQPVIETESYDEVVAKYSNYSTECRKYCATLYPLRKRSIERCLARIRSGSDSVFEQLWVTPSIDRAYLAYLSDTMVRELSGLYDTMNVSMLAQLPPAEQQAILTGSKLLNTCRSYTGRIGANAPLKELVRSYYEIDRDWKQLSPYYLRVTAEPVVNTCRAIDGYCTEIREILGVHSLYDHERALALAASLEDLAYHVNSLSNRYGNYCSSKSLRNGLSRDGAKFNELAKTLHRQIALESAFGDIQKQCNSLVTTWGSYAPRLDSMPQYGLSASRHHYINGLRREINPVIGELAMIFGE